MIGKQVCVTYDCKKGEKRYHANDGFNNDTYKYEAFMELVAGIPPDRHYYFFYSDFNTFDNYYDTAAVMLVMRGHVEYFHKHNSRTWQLRGRGPFKDMFALLQAYEGMINATTAHVVIGT